MKSSTWLGLHYFKAVIFTLSLFLLKCFQTIVTRPKKNQIKTGVSSLRWNSLDRDALPLPMKLCLLSIQSKIGLTTNKRSIRTTMVFHSLGKRKSNSGMHWLLSKANVVFLFLWHDLIWMYESALHSLKKKANRISKLREKIS